MPQGDGTIRISPFDDYILFTLYEDVKEQPNPIDLSNVGKLYLSFIGENDTIRIPNYTNVKEVDMSQGQVLFRISESDSKKILALDNNNFYVSSQMVSKNGDESDESVLYTGTFLSFADEAKDSMTSKYETLLETSTTEVAALQDEVAVLKQSQGIQDQTKDVLGSEIARISNANKRLINYIGELNKDLKSSEIETILAQEAAEEAIASKNAALVQLKNQSEATKQFLSGQNTNPQFLAGLANLNVNVI